MSKELPVIDVYSGVGGLSLGAARAGFRLAAAVEHDKHAIETHAINFPYSVHLRNDVARLSGARLLEQAVLKRNGLCGLIGGPPCQGFSEIGLKDHDDRRNRLLVHFFRLVAETNPSFYLAENVPGMLFPRNKAILDEALSLVPDRYVRLHPITIKANEWGAPTTRTRVFLIGYDPNRVGALNAGSFRPKDVEDVRVSQALSELPAVRAEWQMEEDSWRSVGELDDSRFSRRVMDFIPQGVGDPEAIERYGAGRLVSGFLGTIHEQATIRRFEALAPGETDTVSRCRRLERNGYCPTLRAGTGPDRGSYQAIRPVHPGSPRVIAPREAARLQGFPDWFQFHPTKWHAFRQIGNSVSPIVAEALLRKIAKAMANA